MIRSAFDVQLFLSVIVTLLVIAAFAVQMIADSVRAFVTTGS